MLITGCSSAGSTIQSENAFVSGNGVALFLEEKDRKSAPTISGPTLNAGEITLESNRVTVINVWASWCSPCRAEAPLLQDLSVKYPNVNFVGILTRDNLSAAKSFVDNFKITYSSLIDDEILLKFKSSLSANAIPTTLILDKNNRVAVRFSGAITTVGFEKYLNQVLCEM